MIVVPMGDDEEAHALVGAQSEGVKVGSRGRKTTLNIDARIDLNPNIVSEVNQHGFAISRPKYRYFDLI
jgi:hypothetical protein